MFFAKVGGIRDPMKQELALEVCRIQSNDISNLAETHVNQDQLHQIRNKWFGPIFCFPGEFFSKGMLVLLNPGFNYVTYIDISPKGRFISFKVAPSEDRLFCIYAPSGHNNRQQLARRRFFEGLQTYIEDKNQGNEKKIIIGDFNNTLDQMNTDVGNKTNKRYRCHSTFSLSKLMNPDEFTRYDRSSGTRSRIDRA